MTRQRPDYAVPFLKRMMKNLNREVGIKRKHNDRYTAQTLDDVLAIYDLCVETNPDIVIDVGTSWGGSCMALALAMKTLDRSLGCITTICFGQHRWPEITRIHRKIIRRRGLQVGRIKKVSSDFAELDPKKYIREGKSVMMFYDIHDYARKRVKAASSILLNEWIPLIEEGAIAVHDMIPIPDDWDVKQSRHHHATKATYWKGGTFGGFAECKPIIEWLNEHKAKMNSVGTEIIWFPIKDGKPVRVRKKYTKKAKVEAETKVEAEVKAKVVEVKDVDTIHDVQTISEGDDLPDTERRNKELDAPEAQARDNGDGEGKGSGKGSGGIQLSPLSWRSD